MKSGWFTAHPPPPSRTSNLVFFTRSPSVNFNHQNPSLGFGASYPKFKSEPSHSFSTLCSFNSSPLSAATNPLDAKTSFNTPNENQWKVEIASPALPSYIPAPKLSLSDQAFFLLAFISCTTSVAFISLVVAAVPTLYAMGRAAISLSKLADTACQELPSTMAAIRLSGMEISDLTLELSDLSQEIADGVNKSTQAVQAAEAGIRQIGYLARQQTMSIIQERASLPTISLQPIIEGAAKKTSRAVGEAAKSFMSIISRRESSSENKDGNTVNRIEM